MKCAIYARYSSDNQKETSIEDQIRECKSYIDQHGWELSEEHLYKDYALSGADTSRPNYLALKKAASLQQFEAIIVDDLSRLGRDMGESIVIFKELQSYGVFTVSVADGIDTSLPSGKLPYYFKGIMNEVFLDDMKAKVIRGLKGQVMRGYSAGGRVYGYKTESVLDPSGELDKFGNPRKLGSKIFVDAEQANVVRRIFGLRLNGLGYRAIAHSLNQENVPAPRADTPTGNRHWSPGTVRTILMNKKYIGAWEYNKVKRLNKRVPDMRRSVVNKVTDWVEYKSEDLRIVPDSDFYAVAALVKSRSTKTAAGAKKYLLSGLLRCANCGGSMVVVNAGRYSSLTCNTARNKGRSVCENGYKLERSIVETEFLSELRKVLLAPSMTKLILKKIQERIDVIMTGSTLDPKSLQREKRKVEGQLNNLLQYIEAGDSSESVRSRIAQREEDLRALNNKIEHAKQSPVHVKKVTLEKVQDMILGFNKIITKQQDNIPLLRSALSKVFPEKISVSQKLASNGVKFKLLGNAYLGNLFEPIFTKNVWRPQGDLNPRRRRERAVS